MVSTDDSRPPLRWRQCWWRPFAFAAGLVALFAALYAVGHDRYLSPQVKYDRRNLERIETRRGVVFGSSHGFNVLPAEAGLDGVNLSHGGQDLFEMVYMARAVKRRAPKLATVVFTVSYFSFAFDNAAYVQRGTQTRIGRRIVLYAAFPSPGFIPGDSSSWAKGLLFPVVTSDHWKNVLWPSSSNRRALPKGSDLPPDPDEDGHVASAKAVVSHANSRCKQYSRLMRNMTSHHAKLDDDAFEALRDVSRELEDAGVRVVLLTPPYFETYNECFDRRRQALTRKLAARIAKDTGAEYIDASREPEFTTNRALFRNSDHMNRAGKVEFSRWLKRRLAHREKP